MLYFIINIIYNINIVYCIIILYYIILYYIILYYILANSVGKIMKDAVHHINSKCRERTFLVFM